MKTSVTGDEIHISQQGCSAVEASTWLGISLSMCVNFYKGSSFDFGVISYHYTASSTVMEMCKRAFYKLLLVLEEESSSLRDIEGFISG